MRLIRCGSAPAAAPPGAVLSEWRRSSKPPPPRYPYVSGTDIGRVHRLEFPILGAPCVGRSKEEPGREGFVSPVGEETRERARAAALDAAVVVALSAKGASREVIAKAVGRPNTWVRKVQRLYGLSKDQVYSTEQLLV